MSRAERLFELPAGNSPEAAAGALLRNMAEPTALSAQRLAAIRNRLEATARPAWRAPAIAAAVFFSASAALAGMQWFEPFSGRSAAPDGQNGAVSAAPDEPRRGVPAVTPAPIETQAASASAPPRAAPLSRPPDPPNTSETLLSRESKLFEKALATLRRDADPARALALLDEYRKQFPKGAFASEASIARVEALLALGRNPEALRALDTLALQRLPRQAELFTLRAELRAAAGRCAEAHRDASTAEPHASGKLAERLARVRDSCGGMAPPSR